MKKELKTKIYLIPLFLLAAVLIPILTWTGLFNPEVSTGHWFQRSGSLVVLCAAILEYLLFRITIAATPASGGKSRLDAVHKTSPRFLRYIQGLKYLTAVMAIIGTVIWGYGDLIYAAFM